MLAKIAPERPTKGIVQLTIKASSQPLKNAIPNPPKTAVTVYIILGTFSPSAPEIAKQSVAI